MKYKRRKEMEDNNLQAINLMAFGNSLPRNDFELIFKEWKIAKILKIPLSQVKRTITYLINEQYPL